MRKSQNQNKTENHLDKRYPLHNLSTYHCNVTSKFYADPSSAGRQMKYRKDLFPLLDTRDYRVFTRM